MPEQDHLRDYEVKLIRIVAKMESIVSRCDDISRRVNEDLVTHDKLLVVQTELDTLKKSVAKNEESSAWILKTFFVTMLSAAAGLFGYLIQKG